MPLPLHIVVAACWYHFHVLLGLQRYGAGGAKPRLLPRRSAINRAIANSDVCKHLSRVSSAELHQLCTDLRITDEHVLTYNWRFTPLQRLFLFLFCFGNHVTSRKMRFASGWAANACLNNFRVHVRRVIEVLDADDSRTCAAPAHHLA